MKQPLWTAVDHVRECEAWIREMAEDLGEPEDVIAWDTVKAYVCSELGEDTPMSKDVLRMMLGITEEGI